MKNESGYSITANMSLGFVPMIITIILSEFISSDIAVYVGAATGILFFTLFYFIHKPRTIHAIALSSAVILVAFSIIAFIMGPQNEWPQHLLPLTLEMAIILPLLILFLGRKKISAASSKNKEANNLKERIHITALTVSCIRTFFALTTIHFAFITLTLVFTRSLDSGFMWFLLHIVPTLVFILSSVVGHIEIRVLESVEAPEFVPVVTPQGEVVGKIDKNLSGELKNEHTHPIIRIATVSHNMLFLAKRSSQRIIDKGKMDTPLETYLLFNEDINDGVERLLKEVFPEEWKNLKPEFSIKYKFKNEETDRIIYLFILDLGMEDNILCDPKFEEGKLWTFQQIDYNLDQNYFSEMFENEYDHLRLIIETREIYKGS